MYTYKINVDEEAVPSIKKSQCMEDSASYDV
jgi:hypothetical protein